MITIMLLGFALDQIPDPNFAGVVEIDERDEAEKGDYGGSSVAGESDRSRSRSTRR
jgi:hypothetical protein